MKKLVAALLSLSLLLLPSTALAAKAIPTGDLTITSIDARFGGEVTFSATVSGLKPYQYPLVYLACYQNGTLVYGQLDSPTTVFILGGGSSPWHQSPGSADCRATLYAYPGFHNAPILLLEQTDFFEVSG